MLAHVIALPSNEKDSLYYLSEFQVMEIRTNDFIKDEFNVVEEEWHIWVTDMCRIVSDN